MKRNLVLGMGLVIVCAVVAMTSLRGSTISLLSFAEAAGSTEPCQVFGRLDKNSIHALQGGNLVRFDLIEEKTAQRLTVLYDNPRVALSANFPTASHAKATGSYDSAGHRFVADSVLTKCPSKYEKKDVDLGTREAVRKWHREMALSARRR